MKVMVLFARHHKANTCRSALIWRNVKLLTGMGYRKSKCHALCHNLIALNVSHDKTFDLHTINTAVTKGLK